MARPVMPDCHDMARSEPKDQTPTSIADLLDEASKHRHRTYPLKVDLFLDTLEPGVRARVIEHLRSDMSNRQLSGIISKDPSTPFTIAPSSVGQWRDRDQQSPQEA